MLSLSASVEELDDPRVLRLYSAGHEAATTVDPLLSQREADLRSLEEYCFAIPEEGLSAEWLHVLVESLQMRAQVSHGAV